MPPRFDRPIFTDPHQVAAPLGYPDLSAVGFKLQPNHNARQLYVFGVIANHGTGPVYGPFKVVIGVSYRNGGQSNTVEQIFTIEGGVPVGGAIQTPFSQVNLIYFDEDSTAIYTFEMIVDANYDITDLRSYNNRIDHVEKFYSPAAFKSSEPVLFERLSE